MSDSDLDCQKCGACCLDQLVVLMPGDNVPFHMTIDKSCVSVMYNEGLPDGLTPLDHCVGLVMNNQFGRCIALEGKVGVEVSCKIYENRPVVCRVMKKGTEACREMRVHSYLADAEPT